MSEARIYRYVVAYDWGTAPRPWDGVCSLAICKPLIRAAARPGDWVVGFRSRHPGEVLYAMQVGEVMGLGDYWDDKRFRNRRPGASSVPDNLYMRHADGQLRQAPNDVHGPESAVRDLSGRSVLLATRYWYFGRESVPLPNHLMHLVHTTQGHAVHKARRVGDVRELEAWLAAWPVGVHGQPVNQDVAVQGSRQCGAEKRGRRSSCGPSAKTSGNRTERKKCRPRGGA